MAPADPDDARSLRDTEDASGDPPRRDPGFDEDRLYEVVTRAVEDAVLGAIGTVILVALAVGLVWIGIAVVAANPNFLGAIFGGIAIVVGFYLAATTLEVVPPIRDW